LSEYKLRIHTLKDHSEVSFFSEKDVFEVKAEFDFQKASDIARIYYGEESEGSKTILNEIESKYLSGRSVRHHGSIFSIMLRAVGEYMFRELLPSEIINKILSIPKDSLLLLDLNTGAALIPWEYMYTGTNFLSLDYIIGRSEQESSVSHIHRFSSTIPMLIVSNPTGDLKATQGETNYIINQLRGSNIRPTRYGQEITKIQYASLLKSGKFDIVHYSGHSASSMIPGESFHVFRDGPLFGREIETLSSNMMPKLVFCNSCQSGESSIGKEMTGNSSLSSCYLKAGVGACIGAIWPVSDIGSADFASNVYRYILFGSTIGEAMLRSKRNSFKRWGYQDMVWSSFLLFGDPNIKIA
jgi:hypothetical protein